MNNAVQTFFWRGAGAEEGNRIGFIGWLAEVKSNGRCVFLRSCNWKCAGWRRRISRQRPFLVKRIFIRRNVPFMSQKGWETEENNEKPKKTENNNMFHLFRAISQFFALSSVHRFHFRYSRLRFSISFTCSGNSENHRKSMDSSEILMVSFGSWTWSKKLKS